MRIYSVPVFAVVAAAVLALAGAALATPSRSARVTLATVSSLDYRVSVAAERTSAGAAPTAAVTVTTFRRAGGRWLPSGVHQLSGTFFWKTVTAPKGVCDLAISTAAKPRVTVRLLETPALGCARAETIALASA